MSSVIMSLEHTHTIMMIHIFAAIAASTFDLRPTTMWYSTLLTRTSAIGTRPCYKKVWIKCNQKTLHHLTTQLLKRLYTVTVRAFFWTATINNNQILLRTNIILSLLLPLVQLALVKQDQSSYCNLRNYKVWLTAQQGLRQPQNRFQRL